MGSNPEGITRAARGAAPTSGWFYENAGHPGGVGGFLAARAVFDDDAVGGLQAEAIRRGEEEVGCGLERTASSAVMMASKRCVMSIRLSVVCT